MVLPAITVAVCALAVALYVLVPTTTGAAVSEYVPGIALTDRLEVRRVC